MELQKNSQVASSVHHHLTLKGLQDSTILVVDDDLINQKILSRFLEKWGIRVIIARNGEQAVAELKSNLVNLVLMDLQMPRIDGYEAARIIRSLKDNQKSKIPIIALTAAALKGVKEKVFESGMNDYLTKPCKPDELRKKLESFILDEG